MNKRVKVEFADLEARLGYRFNDPELARLALTHLSAQATGGYSYQRLEFLGDRVLGVVAADHLYRSFPQASEGELSMRLAKLVRRETCAAIATEWDVGPHVVLGLGEARGGGRKKAAILSDVCESLIGAVYVDGGFEAARALTAPRYEEVARSGPAHAPLFVMRVVLPGYEPETGEANSKRAAEQAAAQAFLDRWGDT